MNRLFLFLLIIAVVLPASSLLAGGPTDAQLALQVTITPTAFNYLPFVAKNWPLVPTPTPTPTTTPTPKPTATPPPGRPVRGYWSGENTEFTVSADSRYVCSFSMSWPGFPGACGLISSHSVPCEPIDANGHFLYDASFGGDITRYEGDFTSATTANGIWTVRRGTCSANGAWSANITAGGPFNCNQIGTVEICAWVANPIPARFDWVTVYGQLLDGGVGRNNLPMHTVWHYETTTATCDRQTGSDGAGLARCSLNIGQAEVGYTVIIDVTITYDGQMYTASTSFTPR